MGLEIEQVQVKNDFETIFPPLLINTLVLIESLI